MSRPQADEDDDYSFSVRIRNNHLSQCQKGMDAELAKTLGCPVAEGGDLFGFPII